jgi:signal transduction histidine kinase
LGFYRDSASRIDVNVSQVLDEVLNLYARKFQFKKVDVRTDFVTSVHASAYPGEGRQIFANLSANAIEALPVGGVLRIRVREVGTFAGAHRKGVRVTFLDNGSGITKRDSPRIFEPFFTTKKDVGTGLGLWLTRNLVLKHTGSLRLKSSATPGRSGTAFFVFLPKYPPPN